MSGLHHDTPEYFDMHLHSAVVVPSTLMVVGYDNRASQAVQAEPCPLTVHKQLCFRVHDLLNVAGMLLWSPVLLCWKSAVRKSGKEPLVHKHARPFRWVSIFRVASLTAPKQFPCNLVGTPLMATAGASWDAKEDCACTHRSAQSKPYK